MNAQFSQQQQYLNTNNTLSPLGNTFSPTAGGNGLSPTAHMMPVMNGLGTPVVMPNPAVPTTMQAPMMNHPGLTGMSVNTGMWPQGMMGMHQSAANVMQHNQALQYQAQQRSQQVSNSNNNDEGSVLGKQINVHTANNDDKSMISHSIFSGGRPEGKFIDNVGGAYPIRTKPIISPMRDILHRRDASPKTPSQVRRSPTRPSRHSSTQSQPAANVITPSSARRRQTAASVRSNKEELARSNRKLNDLKTKNEVIRKDIERMKNCMESSSVANSRKYDFPDEATVEDTIARAMKKSDEMRSSHMSCNGSVASGSLKQRQCHLSRHSRSSNYSSRKHHRRQDSGQQHQQQRGGGYSKRQPPSPLRTTKEEDQEFFHV